MELDQAGETAAEELKRAAPPGKEGRRFSFTAI